MAGSHEVRGSIPLGSTTDTRGARRRRRAPLFLLPGWKGLIGQKACLIQGRRRGPAPLSRSPAPRARRPRRTRSGASRRSATGRGRIRRLAASAPPSSKGPIGPRKAAARRRRKGRRRNRGRSRFGGGGFANPGIGGLPEAPDVRRPSPAGRPARRRRHRARQRGPEEGAHLSAGVRRPRPAPPRARPMRPAARRGDGASGAGLHGPRGVRERGIVPVKNAWLAVADPPSARTRPPPRRSRRRRRRRRGGA